MTFRQTILRLFLSSLRTQLVKRYTTLCNVKFHYRIHKIPLQNYILAQLNLVPPNLDSQDLKHQF
jgi:hypothetical protein